jgi:hypothetical protein
MMKSFLCLWFLLFQAEEAATTSLPSKNSRLKEIAAAIRGAPLEWQIFRHAKPLISKNLVDISRWILGKNVRTEDIELFQPSKHYHLNQNAVMPTGPLISKSGKKRLNKVLKGFRAGQGMVINSIQRWDPKVAQLVEELQKLLWLPVDAFVFFAPPAASSYSMHHDSMDGLIFQIEGSKHWTICSGFLSKVNCTDVVLRSGDVMYVPMGSKHKAWTTCDLSAHFTLSIERQHFMWGSVITAINALNRGKRLKKGMRSYSMEGETKFSQKLETVAKSVPALLLCPPLTKTPEFRAQDKEAQHEVALVRNCSSILHEAISASKGKFRKKLQSLHNYVTNSPEMLARVHALVHRTLAHDIQPFEIEPLGVVELDALKGGDNFLAIATERRGENANCELLSKKTVVEEL